jgi:RES domain-containing protein
LKIHAPDEVHVDRISVEELPPDWPNRIDVTRAFSDDWLTRGSAALLTVPSAIVPETFNVLLNPVHPDATHVAILGTGEHAIDPRLLK